MSISPQSNLNGRVGKVTEYKFDSDGKIHTRVISGGEFEKDINLQPGRSKVYQYVNNN
jgi:hypothetical protein